MTQCRGSQARANASNANVCVYVPKRRMESRRRRNHRVDSSVSLRVNELRKQVNTIRRMSLQDWPVTLVNLRSSCILSGRLPRGYPATMAAGKTVACNFLPNLHSRLPPQEAIRQPTQWTLSNAPLVNHHCGYVIVSSVCNILFLIGEC